MLKSTQETLKPSAFHKGEMELQKRAGKRDVIESFGQKAVRSFMPDQHRDFYAQLPFMIVGGVDEKNWPWASILIGRPGFINSPDNETLEINAQPISDDPLNAIIKSGTPLGMLGIELATRRRNRVNGRIKKTNDKGFQIAVDQSFGNCPQYIQQRSLDFVREPSSDRKPKSTRFFANLDEASQNMIRTADTFFVASFLEQKHNPAIEGVDVSHRGGRPGFVKVEGNRLTIPEYAGNNFFNTMGNFLLNPKAGLLFVDFATGDLLFLTGTVEILIDEHEGLKHFKGAERGWQFNLSHGIFLQRALPFRSKHKQESPNTILTGTWQEAAAVMEAERKRETWRPFKVVSIEQESALIRSFYLEPNDQGGLVPNKPGQFLTIRIKPKGNKKEHVIGNGDGAEKTIRTYTLSSISKDKHYRISVKKEAKGAVSDYLHNSLKVGDTIEAKAPQGDFYLQEQEKRPAVLIAGGVGITPMISIARHAASQAIATRYLRPVTIFHAARTIKDRAFSQEFKEIEKATKGSIRYISFISQPKEVENPGKEFDEKGRITKASLQKYLPLDDYDFYLCGPASFMQTQYDQLKSLNVPEKRIFAESFGPSTLVREHDQKTKTALKEAKEAIVKFTNSGFEHQWSIGDPTLLETAEIHGLSPTFGCRNGVCGSCATKLKAGSVAYRTTPSGPHADDEVLICCAVPAKGTKPVELDL